MPKCMLRDGAELDYADQGVGAPLLLVHGWAAHGGFFHDLALRLSATHRVLTPTLRGHLGSSHGAAPLTIETLGEDIAEFFYALDLKGAVALGWSMGAMALWSAAPKVGARLSALIVEEMSPRLVNCSDWPFGLIGGYEASDVADTLADIRADWPSYAARLAPRMFAPATRAANPDLITWTAAQMAAANPESMAALWASMTAQDFRAALAAIEVPLLTMQGSESSIHPHTATAFAAQVARAGRHLTISGAGHVPHLEAPDQFFEHVIAFANTTRRLAIEGGTRP